jgi:hypothetical protein
MAQLGHGALLLAFALAIFGVAASVFGERRRVPELSIAGVRAVVGVTVLLFVAAAVLVTAFVTHDFSFAYVSGRSSTDMPLRYIVTAFYGGQEGSLLFWAMRVSGDAGLFSVHALLRGFSVRAERDRTGGRARAEPAAARSGHDDSPADAPVGIRQLRDPILDRGGGADLGADDD